MPELEDDTDEEVPDYTFGVGGELNPHLVLHMPLPERQEWCKKAIIEGKHPQFQADPNFVEFWQPARRKSTSVCDIYGLRVKIDKEDGTSDMYFVCLEGDCAGPQCFGKRIKTVLRSTVRATAHLKEYHGVISNKSLLREERKREKEEIGPPPIHSPNYPSSFAALVAIKRETTNPVASAKRRGRPPKHSKVEPDSESEGDHGGDTYDDSRRESFRTAAVGHQYEKNPSRKRKESLAELEKAAKKLRSDTLEARSKIDRILAEEESAKNELFDLSDELARIESGQFYSTQTSQSVEQRLRVLRTNLVRMKDDRANFETLITKLRNELYETQLDIAESEGDEMKRQIKAQASASAPGTNPGNDKDNDSAVEDSEGV